MQTKDLFANMLIGLPHGVNINKLGFAWKADERREPTGRPNHPAAARMTFTT
jgi:hypothetical protein